MIETKVSFFFVWRGSVISKELLQGEGQRVLDRVMGCPPKPHL